MKNKISDTSTFNNKIKELTLSLRKKVKYSNSISPPEYCFTDNYRFGNKLYSRLRTVLKTTGGCSASCTMCPIPNESIDQNTLSASPCKDYVHQVETALQKYTDQKIISLYTENFFSEKEIDKVTFGKILSLIKKTKCEFLLISSLPSFITREKINAAHDILGDKIKLIVAMGLQSANNEIRKECIRAPLTIKGFLKAHKIIKEFGYFTKSYILLKPAFLLREEAIKDTVGSALWLHENGINDDITICIVRIAHGTIIKDLYDKKLHSPAKLTTLVECLNQIQQKKINARVSLNCAINTIEPTGCKNCEEKIKNALKDYNNGKTINFGELKCQYCSAEEKRLDPKEFIGLSFRERISYWLELVKKENSF